MESVRVAVVLEKRAVVDAVSGRRVLAHAFRVVVNVGTGVGRAALFAIVLMYA